MTEVAFYCVADERYFLGAVAMINSLRLQGHAEQVFVLDCGLTEGQRELLAGQVELVAGGAAAPWLSKTVAPLRHPAEVMVLIDADMIVTRPLDELIEAASGDRIVAFENDRQRFCAEWGELLGLGPLRPRRYVSSGLVLLGGPTGREVLGLLDELQPLVDVELTFARGNDPDYPFLYPEQDVLNAILAARVDPARIVALDHRLAPNPPFAKLRIVDEARLRCAHRDGLEPFVLHQFVRKPWLEPMYHGIYSQLLARMLLGADIAIGVPSEQVPLRMRSGARARVERTAVNIVDLGRWYLGERLPAWTERRIRALRRREEVP